MCSSVRHYTLFSRIFFCERRLHTTAKTKESATSFSLFLFYSYIYIRNKSHLEFFFLSRAISLTASLQQATHGVRKQEKKEIDFYIWSNKCCKNTPVNDVIKKRKKLDKDKNELIMQSENSRYVNDIIDTRSRYTHSFSCSF